VFILTILASVMCLFLHDDYCATRKCVANPHVCVHETQSSSETYLGHIRTKGLKLPTTLVGVSNTREGVSITRMDVAVTRRGVSNTGVCVRVCVANPHACVPNPRVPPRRLQHNAWF